MVQLAEVCKSEESGQRCSRRESRLMRESGSDDKENTRSKVYREAGNLGVIQKALRVIDEGERTGRGFRYG